MFKSTFYQMFAVSVFAFAIVVFSPSEKVFAAEPFRILVSNDDGIDSEGILALVRELEKIAEVTVVAPMQNQSGAGNSITIKGPLIVNEIKREGKFFGYGIDCTPATCVNLGVEALMEKKPDLVVSGINEGFNIGLITWVSGTFGAARAAVLKGIPGIAVSLARGENMDYSIAAEFTRILVEKLRAQGFPREVVLNVNFPACSREQIKGIALTTSSNFQWKESWLRRKNPHGKTYFWGQIRKPVLPPEVGTDHWALNENLISVTPVPVSLDASGAKKFFSRFSLTFDGKEVSNFLGR